MNTLLKLGIGLIAFLVLSSLLIPAAIFIYELVSKPDLINLKTSYEQLNETSIKLVFSITYKGTIPLSDVKIEIFNKTLYFGDLPKNTTLTKYVVLNIITLPERPEVLMSLKIAGIYRLELRMRGVE
ncbi:MAG: hypothetical protein QN229_03720 [Desulfurococcaceae archaeon TW002]